MATGKKTFTVITGASRGIGAELARVFAGNGHHLVLVGRTATDLAKLAAELRETHKVEVLTKTIDLADEYGALSLADDLGNDGIVVEHLVNNAGFGTYGPFAKSDLDTDLGMLRLNMLAIVTLTRRLLPAMISRKQGGILNVASTAAFQPGPLMATYYASKAFVLSFSEALHKELESTGVRVSCLCPGITRSGFQKRAQIEGVRLASKAATLADPHAVAKAGYRGLMSGQRLVIPGFKNRLGAFLTRLVPRSTVLGIIHKLQSPS